MKLKESNTYSTNMVISIKDWRQALRTPPSYRVGSSTLRIQTKFVSIIALTGLLLLLIVYITPFNKISNEKDRKLRTNSISFTCKSEQPYNHSYPLSVPLIYNGIRTFRIGVIADLDTNSKSKEDENTWYSYLRKGYLSYNNAAKTVHISWDKKDDIQIKSTFSSKGRGMELSDLVVFNGRLFTFDDRSGIVYEIINDKVIPWIILVDGDGKSSKGFKSEWATVKDQMLIVGSMGKEWTTEAGEFSNHNPMYIKCISVSGEVQHLNWISEYKSIRSVLGIKWPGYMIHESGVWSDVHSRWFFLPRRCSKERYNETKDEVMGCNVLISADSDFKDVKATKIGELKPTHGFSSFKFIPSTDDQAIIALKTEEYNGSTATYITAFTIEGQELMVETKISDLKFEGIEFI